jgi:ABC-type thiamine transport system substrate-binding protein
VDHADRHAEFLIEFTGEKDYELPTAISEWKNQSAFTAYNYAPIAFIARKDFHGDLRSLNDILKPEFKGKISLQADPEGYL